MKFGTGLSVALLLTLAAFFGAVFGAMVFDDFHSVVKNPAVRELSNIPRFFLDPSLFSMYGGSGSYRPITLATYSLTFALFGDSSAAFHAGNLLIHMLAVAAFIVLLECLFRRYEFERPVEAAMIGSLAFGVHPATSQVVHYVSSRSESLALLGVLGSAASFALLLSSSRRVSRSVGLSLLSILFAGLALGSKETGVLVAAVLPAVYIVARPGGRDAHRRLALATLGVVLILVALYAWHFLGIGAGGGSGLLKPSKVSGAIADPWIVRSLRADWIYWALSLFPKDLAVFRELPPSGQPLRSVVVAVVILAAGVLMSAVLLFTGGRRKLLGLTGVLFFVPLLPYVVKPLRLAVNENRMYPVLLGLALAVGMGWEWLGHTKRWSGHRFRSAVAVVAVLLLMAALVRDWRASWVWASEIRLWENAVEVSPWSGDMRAGLGTAYMREQRWEEAEEQFLEALEKPSWQRFVIYDNLGIANYWLGRKGEALRFFRMAYQANPASVEVLANLGGILHEMGQNREALPFLEKAVRLNPEFCQSRISVLQVMMELGDTEFSSRQFRALPAHCRQGEDYVELSRGLQEDDRN